MHELVTDPDAFFASRATEPRLSSAAAVVCVASLASIGSAFLVFLELLDAVSGAAGRFLVVGYAIGLGGAFLGTLLAWVLYAGAFYVLSEPFGGRGSARLLVAVVGWGFVPIIAAGLASTVGMFHALQAIGTGFPHDPGAIEAVVRHLRTAPAVRLAGVLGIPLTLWSGMLWTFAVTHARDIPLRHAALVVAMPVGLSIAWQTHTLL